jgi:hypothetical protein
MAQTQDLFPAHRPIFERQFRRYACQTMTNLSFLESASDSVLGSAWVQELEAARALMWAQALASVSLPLRAKAPAALRVTSAEPEMEQRWESVSA